VILHGYDAVAYFTVNKPVKGVATYSAKHDGATYWFSSAENLAAFKADPQKYAPQFGGFCAFGVTKEAKVDGDPTVFKVEGGKLYVNLNPQVGKLWLQDVPGNIKEAQRIWPSISNKAPQDL
jgi:YHS domain-containing protein